ncbi:MAG: hypothetical protein CMM87_00545 [Rickettsiales bacterium]|nr:hypothetical protein [Rickettsiales bacterium]|tara:strand:+ start:78749 stop:79276 length:528 start_codon:yes stop_codon:yes gene_type:complete
MTANILTSLRIVLTPFIIGMLLHGRISWAFWLFFIAGLTDFFDGMIARAFKQETSLGKILDPIADKVLIIGVLATLYGLGWIPLWLIAVILLRDLMIFAGFLYTRLKDVDLEPRPLMLSKINTFWQVVTVVLLILQRLYGFDSFYSKIACWILVCTTVLSGFQYAMVMKRELSKR